MTKHPKQTTKNVPGVQQGLVSPTSDVFTAAFFSARKHEPELRNFINAVMTDYRQPLIQEATVLNPFNQKEFAVDKQFVLDVRVRDEMNRWYNLEFQTWSHVAFCERMLLHWSDMYAAQLESGDHFTELRPVRSILLTVFPIFPTLRNLHTVFEICSRENPAVLLTDHFQMHVLRLGDMLKRKLEGFGELYGGLQNWFSFFAFADTTPEDKMNQLVENNPAVLTAYEELRRFSSNEEMRDLERRRRRFIEDQRIYAGAAKAEGKAEGIAEGIAKRDIEIARNMKLEGSDFDYIARITGLPLTEIERLG
jgi:predicted transposase/invertase (TIGR01784 family)